MPSLDQHSNLTDDELLRLHRKSKDNRWMGLLLQRYTILLLGVGIKYLKDKDQAADAVQQVFLKALTSLPDGEINNFKGWLYILMRNHCFQLLRNKKYNAGEEVIAGQEAYEAPDKEALQEQEYTIDQMKEAVTELEEGQQVCISMFYFEQCTYLQIMEQKGYSFMQVKSYIQNGKRKLKKILIAKLEQNKGK